MAARNIALVNKITKAYGMELGYISRLKLFKMVLKNMVFAGATEIATDVGMDFFSQNLRRNYRSVPHKVLRGFTHCSPCIKAMEFCRPVAFQANEKPRISAIRQSCLLRSKIRYLLKQKRKKVFSGLEMLWAMFRP